MLSPSGTGIVGLLANADISDLAFVNQFFKLLPRRIGVLGQGLIDYDLPLALERFPLEGNRPAVHPSTLGVATGNWNTHQ